MENIYQPMPSKDKARQVARAIKIKMVSFIGAGLALVIGLAWNDAIAGLITYLYPDKGNSVIAKLIYAMIVTIVISLILFFVEKSIEEDTK